ncbi:anti-sigma factor family protein [Streptomyces bullii]|uniref:Anti-sigma factor family protein n=1 Tax=Streptomyces bullii TaxID=349910 RepID=A0ABW0UK39_9ACTN
MTSTTDMAGHPDVTEISDLAEGILPPARTADVRQHLDECELCADVYATLEEIRGLLGTLPGPPRMPADVAGRIDAALAAEALLQATAPESVDAPEAVGASRADEGEALPADEGGTQRSGEADSAHVSRETSAPTDRPAGRPRSSTTGPGRKSRSRTGRRRIAVLGAVFTAAALGLGSVLVASVDGGKPSSNAERERQSAPADTFSEGKLEKQVTDLLAQNQSAGGDARTPHTFGGQTVPNSGGPRILKVPAVPECVREGIGRSEAALAAENGRYKGTKAMLVVLPDASDPTRVTAYIVETTCVDHASSTAKGKVLLEHSYARSER